MIERILYLSYSRAVRKIRSPFSCCEFKDKWEVKQPKLVNLPKFDRSQIIRPKPNTIIWLSRVKKLSYYRAVTTKGGECPD